MSDFKDYLSKAVRFVIYSIADACDWLTAKLPETMTPQLVTASIRSRLEVLTDIKRMDERFIQKSSRSFEISFPVSFSNMVTEQVAENSFCQALGLKPENICFNIHEHNSKSGFTSYKIIITVPKNEAANFAKALRENVYTEKQEALKYCLLSLKNTYLAAEATQACNRISEINRREKEQERAIAHSLKVENGDLQVEVGGNKYSFNDLAKDAPSSAITCAEFLLKTTPAPEVKDFLNKYISNSVSVKAKS